MLHPVALVHCVALVHTTLPLEHPNVSCVHLEHTLLAQGLLLHCAPNVALARTTLVLELLFVTGVLLATLLLLLELCSAVHVPQAPTTLALVQASAPCAVLVLTSSALGLLLCAICVVKVATPMQWGLPRALHVQQAPTTLAAAPQTVCHAMWERTTPAQGLWLFAPPA